MANRTKVSTFYISEKISKIRWLNSELNENANEFGDFITGSWDMPQCYLKLWHLDVNELAEEFNEYVPKCDYKHAVDGDITGMELFNNNCLISCSNGKIILYDIKYSKIEQEACSDLLHYVNNVGEVLPCTGLSVYNDEVATIGEDGRINIIDIKNNLKLKRSIQTGGCSLMAVKYVNYEELLVGNRMGVLRLYDTRAPNAETAVAAFMTSNEDDKQNNYVSTITSYPTQKHVILCGSEEGSITVWDLRQPVYPASYLSAHTGPISELNFHSDDPTKLLTSSMCGELWLWSQNSHSTDAANPIANTNPWLNGERTKNLIDIKSLITDLHTSIDTFDTKDTKVICGSDSEALYFINNIY